MSFTLQSFQSCSLIFNSLLPFQPLQPHSFLSSLLQYFQHCPLIFNLALSSSILTMHIQSCPYFFKFINPFHSYSLLYSVISSLLQTCLPLFNPLLPSSTCSILSTHIQAYLPLFNLFNTVHSYSILSATIRYF